MARKNENSPRFKGRGIFFGFALPSILVLTLIPAGLLHKGKRRWIEKLDDFQVEEADRLTRIYSVLKSHNGELPERSVWAVAQTILSESARHSLDPMLVLAIINVESRFQHDAVSPDGARGLMQLRPVVVLALAEEANPEARSKLEALMPESLDDPILNVRLGVSYLGYLKKNFKQTALTLAAYHQGPTEIKNRLQDEREVPSDYSAKVLFAYHSYRTADSTAEKSFY